MATARHPKATFFVQRHLFSGLTRFAELESKIAALPDEQARGAAFEVFAEAYLATQRKHDAAQVWPHGTVPLDILKNLGLTQSDQGVDGVLQTLLGQFNAYQVKFRTGRPALTWRELSTFIGLADSPHIHSRVLLTNCDELPAVLNDRQGFFCIRGADLDRLEAGDFRAMEAWLADAAYIAPKKSPQPHQIEALAALLPALQTHDRVSAIMACGTGKTLVALWVAENVAQTIGSRGATNDNSPAFQRRVQSAEISSPAGTTEVSKTNQGRGGNDASSGQPSRWDSMPAHQQPGVETPGYVSGCPVGTNAGGISAAKILILLPSLALLRQTLHEWLRETRLPNLAYLCVCSDPTVKEGLDALATQQSDLDFQVSTAAASVRSFLDAPFAGVKMIFSTYQSACVVGAAMPPGEAFDFAVFDEAHKTAGREGRNFAFALDDKNLPIRKRLFLTATPRHYNPHDLDREGEARLLFSMDNPAVYGPQTYRLTFAEAARRGIICGYKVIISVITSEMVTNELLSHGEVLVNGDAVRARQVANQIALRDAIEKYGVSKVFTFHKTVASAASFVADGSEGIRTHLPEFKTFHVNGSMSTARREHEMRDFRAATQAVVSNARCLTEGVDVPAVDMVAFLSPRRSRVDIVQATGRAMRRSPGKTTGYVLVPLYLEQAAGESIEEAVNRAEFDEVWDVLQSLQEQDNVLAEIIRAMCEQKGKTKGFDDSQFRQRVEILGPTISLESIRRAITSACIERLGAFWDERFGELQAFKKLFGHCNVPSENKDFRQLAIWVSTQRSNRSSLTNERVRRLEEIGFVWNLFDSAWEEMFDALSNFRRAQGHCVVPRNWHRNPALSRWVLRQRQDKRKGQLSIERVERLERLDFVWNAPQTAWERMLLKLKDFKRRQGHCNVPPRAPKTYELGRWVAKQRSRREKLSDDQTRGLEKLGFNWDLWKEIWEQMFVSLVEYKRTRGDCNVPRSYRPNQKLARWVHNQRVRRSELSDGQTQRLEKIGFVWDPKNGAWEARFAELIAFKRKHGHCKVPQRSREYSKLATWVSAQRSRRDRLDKARLQRLNRVGFVWDPFALAWEEMFVELKHFKQAHGHCSVSSKSREFHHLAMWVNVQRTAQRKGTIDAERVERLTKLGFDWDPLGSYWKDMFKQLVKFKEQNGHCDVPARWTGNRPLGGWVSNQRALRKKGTLSKDHIRKLNELGFLWIVRGNGKAQSTKE